MIYDHLENISVYYGICVNFEKAASYLLRPDLCSLPVGIYDTGDPDIYFEIRQYTSTPEAISTIIPHRNVGEMSVLLEGEEMAKIAPGCAVKS